MIFNKMQEIAITATDNDHLIWKVDTQGIKLGKTVKLNVGTGCQALIYINGAQNGGPREAGAHELNLKTVLRNKDKLEIIGVRRDAQFVIKFGLSESNSVPYEDKEAKLNTKVSVRGECYCKVLDGAKIYSTYGCRDAVTAADVRENLFGDITQILIDSLAKKLGEYDYLTIAQSINDLSDTVKRLTEQKLFAEGFLLERCSVAQPFFGEGYGESRENAIKAIKAEERKQDERDRELRIVEKSVAASAAKAQAEQKACKCAKCGKQNPAGTKFCQACGNKLF